MKVKDLTERSEIIEINVPVDVNISHMLTPIRHFIAGALEDDGLDADAEKVRSWTDKELIERGNFDRNDIIKIATLYAKEVVDTGQYWIDENPIDNQDAFGDILSRQKEIMYDLKRTVNKLKKK